MSVSPFEISHALIIWVLLIPIKISGSGTKISGQDFSEENLAQVSKLRADPPTSHHMYFQLFPEGCKTKAVLIGIQGLYCRMILAFTREYSINFFI